MVIASTTPPTSTPGREAAHMGRFSSLMVLESGVVAELHDLYVMPPATGLSASLIGHAIGWAKAHMRH